MIPEELKQCNRWVCYNNRKEPVNGRTGYAASTTNSKTWCSYEEAVAGAEKYLLAGIGFVLGGGFAGIDIDKCMENDVVSPEAQSVIDLMDSYTEASPSGTGVHILCKGEKPGSRCKSKKISGAKEIEIYVKDRYFTITGNVRLDKPVNERSAQLKEVYEKYFENEEMQAVLSKTLSTRAHNSESVKIGLQKDKKLIAYYNGKFNMNDESAKDMALRGKLLYWTNNDVDLAIEEFCNSPYAKSKDEEHLKKLDRKDYLLRTAKAAAPASTAALDHDAYLLKGIDSKIKGSISEIIKVLKPHERYTYDDRGNGDLFAEVYKDIARFNATANEWFVYDGKVWQKDTGAMIVSRLAKELKDELLLSSLSIENESQKEAYQKHVIKLGARSARDIMLKDARDRYCISNEDLDRDENLLNCQNGTLDLKTFEFRKHRASDLLSRLANVEYDPEARSELWERFIDEVMMEDQTKIDYLQRAIGYGITADTSLETCFILYGAQTRNGKSTLVETIMHMLGGSSGYSLQMKPESLAQKQTVDSRQASGDIARLQGARFLNVSEPPKKMIFDVALLKTLLGRDSIVARHLHEREFEFIPVFKLFINTNYLPIISDDTLFASGRINVIIFDRKFSEQEQDKTLKSRLREKENLSGILNWCLEGLISFYEKGLTPTKAIEEATAEYRRDSDKLGKFMAECMEKAEENITASSAYSVYESWCRACGYGCENQGNFFAELRTKNLMSKTGTVNGKTKPRVIKGYRFTQEWQPIVPL